MDSSDRSVIAVGHLDDVTVARIREAAAAVDCAVTVVGDAAEIATHGKPPLAVLVRARDPGDAEACRSVRSLALLAQVPVMAIAARADDLGFTELFTWGGDDLVAAPSAEPLERRLRGLRARPPLPRLETARAAHAVVAGSSAPWRSVMGRAVHNGGLGVRFATSAAEAATESRAAGVRVVVAADDLEPDGAVHALAAARASGSACPWVIVAPPKRMASAHVAVGSLGPASVMDGFAPPENVLFVANDLLGARGENKRASPRLLYGTAIAFRVAGRSEDDVGFSYNVSKGGTFVRSLAPPDPGAEVWLETWPPRCDRRVRLVGRVVWTRAFGPVGGATVPAGFAVRLTGGLPEDLERWERGCEDFAAGILGATERLP